jgi:hypothetical protein
MLRDLEAIMVQLPLQSLAALQPNHDIRHLVRQILFLAAESVDRHRTPLLMSQKIVQLLYKTPSQLGREVYVALLDQLCHSFEDVAKEAITWLLYAEDEVSFFCYSSEQSLSHPFLAEIQRTCHRNLTAERTCEYRPPGSTIGEDSVHRPSSELIELCSGIDPRVPVE